MDRSIKRGKCSPCKTLEEPQRVGKQPPLYSAAVVKGLRGARQWGATLGVIRRDGTGHAAQARMWILQLRTQTSRNGRQLASARRRPAN
ncbi:unnamed protein product [Boreogadus saida]